MTKTMWLAVVLTAACTGTPKPSLAPELAGASGRATYFASIVPTTGAGHRLSGAVTLRATSDTSYTVSFTLRGANPNARYAWTIRAGRCGEGFQNADVAPREAYAPIRVRPDGEAQERMNLLADLPDEPLHVDLMPNESRPEDVVACGALIKR